MTQHNDIYGTRRKGDQPGASQADLRPEGKPVNKPYWQEQMKRSRRHMITYWLIAVFLTSALVVIVMQQQQLANQTQPVRPRPEENINNSRSGASPLELSSDPVTSFLAEEMTYHTERELPEDGQAAFSVGWLKEAAYHLLQAEIAVQESRLEDALNSYQNVRSIFPDLIGVDAQLGMLYLRTQDYNKAAAAFSKAEIENPNSATIANNLGVAFMNIDRYSEAERQFTRALELRPQYMSAIYNIATLYARMEDWKQSAEWFERFLELEPANEQAAQSYAYVLLQMENWDQASFLLTQLSRVIPDSPPIYFRLAQALAHTGEMDAAVESLDKGIELVDRTQALAWMSRPEFNVLRSNEGFQDLVDRLTISGN